ncbi:LuxR C-terminal-related transcriptional regulator [Nibricoccus sp. IMCC34717]|uniref:LuxR C-terminal-related transcriptional regulator n=1 Tax=Nibricoccus sp. IMCC34717 TaxID=3034021 RepID=UPI00384B5EA6
MPTSIAIVEDNLKVSSLMASWVSAEPDLVLLGAFSSFEGAVANLADLCPTVALVDVNLAGKSGIECVRRLKPLLPDTQFVMVTVFEDSDHIFDALTAGATGYLLKTASREELIAAIRQAAEGGSPMSSYIARKVVQWFQTKKSTAPEPDQLSARERDILRLLARGLAYKEIADALQVSIGTVNTHIRRIYRKLEVSSRGEAVSLFASFPTEPGAPKPPPSR